MDARQNDKFTTVIETQSSSAAKLEKALKVLAAPLQNPNTVEHKIVGIKYIKATKIMSKARVIPNFATIIQTKINLGESVVHSRKRQNVPQAERANEKIYPYLAPSLPQRLPAIQPAVNSANDDTTVMDIKSPGIALSQKLIKKKQKQMDERIINKQMKLVLIAEIVQISDTLPSSRMICWEGSRFPSKSFSWRSIMVSSFPSNSKRIFSISPFEIEAPFFYAIIFKIYLVSLYLWFAYIYFGLSGN